MPSLSEIPDDGTESLCALDPPSSPDSDSDSVTSTFESSPKADLDKTLTLYDWDDTFLPSTYLASLGLDVNDNEDLPVALSRNLLDLESIVIKIVKEAMSFGEVKIITNAEDGWIELSGARFMPRLTEFLRKNSVKLVSARSAYEGDYPDDPFSWKIAAFAAEVEKTFHGASDVNILVLGDSFSEREAAHALSSQLPGAKVKSVKLIERPNVSQMLRQITLLHGSFRSLRDHQGSLDINLSC